MHNVRRGPVPNIFKEQLDIFAYSGEEVVRVHERGVPRDYGDGVQRFPKNIKEHMRPVYNSAAKRARAAHKVDYQADSVIDKEVEPRDIAVGVLRGSGLLNIGRAQQLNAIRVYQVNAWVLLV